ncbi:unnamed protein product, partial [Phaeothamnion confervicola]
TFIWYQLNSGRRTTGECPWTRRDAAPSTMNVPTGRGSVSLRPIRGILSHPVRFTTSGCRCAATAAGGSG